MNPLGSLLTFVNYNRKKFYDIGPWGEIVNGGIWLHFCLGRMAAKTCGRHFVQAQCHPLNDLKKTNLVKDNGLPDSGLPLQYQNLVNFEKLWYWYVKN
jgi:hypothetical protein